MSLLGSRLFNSPPWPPFLKGGSFAQQTRGEIIVRYSTRWLSTLERGSHAPVGVAIKVDGFQVAKHHLVAFAVDAVRSESEVERFGVIQPGKGNFVSGLDRVDLAQKLAGYSFTALNEIWLASDLCTLKDWDSVVLASAIFGRLYQASRAVADRKRYLVSFVERRVEGTLLTCKPV